MSLLIIDGVEMPTPSDMIPGEEDIGKWDRNARGTMIGDIIATKVKLELTWSFLTAEDLSKILTAIKPQFFNVTYINPETNSRRTALFYKGGRKMPVLSYIDGEIRYKDVSFNLIER